ncbi:hypothetical protein [uncultured Parvibaculum sp.]|uniref:hypothetical protein n=1 Tax=uncultured Parvibaculum sp. TaxID=291828 RepID=UPI0030D9A5D3
MTTLKTKRHQIEAAIAGYERALNQARADLSHVNACIAMFDASGAAAPYVDLHRLFKRGEVVGICKDALAREGNLDTRELAHRVMTAKGLDTGDKVLSRSLCLRIVQALRMQEKRGKIAGAGKRKGVRVWRSAP